MSSHFLDDVFAAHELSRVIVAAAGRGADGADCRRRRGKHRKAGDVRKDKPGQFDGLVG